MHRGRIYKADDDGRVHGILRSTTEKGATAPLPAGANRRKDDLGEKCAVK